ncbi:UNVERIFIED_CONTAM: hypothetical protein K2H54_000867 [Gekko kuhli]
MRREEADDPQPEGKRLKLGDEAGNVGKEGGLEEGGGHSEWTVCLGTGESGTQTDGEGQTRSVMVAGKSVFYYSRLLLRLSALENREPVGDLVLIGDLLRNPSETITPVKRCAFYYALFGRSRRRRSSVCG